MFDESSSSLPLPRYDSSSRQACGFEQSKLQTHKPQAQKSRLSIWPEQMQVHIVYGSDKVLLSTQHCQIRHLHQKGKTCGILPSFWIPDHLLAFAAAALALAAPAAAAAEAAFAR